MTHLIVLTPEKRRLQQPFRSMTAFGWTVEGMQPYDLEDRHLAAADVIYFCFMSDQIYLATIQDRLMAFLQRGGHFVINDHVVIQWLPFLNRFQTVPPRPFTNWMIRPHEPGAYFGRMDFSTFHVHDGVLGQYSRGYSEPPAGGAMALHDRPRGRSEAGRLGLAIPGRRPGVVPCRPRSLQA